MMKDRSTVGKIEERTNFPVRQALAFTTLAKNGLSDADLLTQRLGRRAKLRILHKFGQPLELPWRDLSAVVHNRPKRNSSNSNVGHRKNEVKCRSYVQRREVS
jgi:hypothetical protein